MPAGARHRHHPRRRAHRRRRRHQPLHRRRIPRLRHRTGSMMAWSPVNRRVSSAAIAIRVKLVTTRGAPPSASATSPTTSPDHSSKAVLLRRGSRSSRAVTATCPRTAAAVWSNTATRCGVARAAPLRLGARTVLPSTAMTRRPSITLARSTGRTRRAGRGLGGWAGDLSGRCWPGWGSRPHRDGESQNFHQATQDTPVAHATPGRKTTDPQVIGPANRPFRDPGRRPTTGLTRPFPGA